MTKSDTDLATATTGGPASAIPTVFVDQRYASRTLVLPSGRTAAVKAKRIAVPADDTELAQYLGAHPDFALQE